MDLTTNTLRATLAFFVALAPTVVRGQEIAKIEPLVQEAVRRHPAVRAADRMAGAASEVVAREGALPDPMLSGGVRNLRVDSPRLSSDPMSGVELTIVQDIPFPGKRGRREAVASANADTARREATLAAVGAALRVRQSYWRLHFAEEAQQITREGVDLLDHLALITKARFSVGQAAQQDVFQAQVARGRAAAMLEERKQMVVTARRELNSAVGRPPETPLGPTEAPPEAPAPDRSSVAAAAARANPEVLAMLSRATAASRTLDEARYDRWPDLQLGAGYMFRVAVPGDPAKGRRYVQRRDGGDTALVARAQAERARPRGRRDARSCGSGD